MHCCAELWLTCNFTFETDVPSLLFTKLHPDWSNGRRTGQLRSYQRLNSTVLHPPALHPTPSPCLDTSATHTHTIKPEMQMRFYRMECLTLILSTRCPFCIPCCFSSICIVTWFCSESEKPYRMQCKHPPLLIYPKYVYCPIFPTFAHNKTNFLLQMFKVIHSNAIHLQKGNVWSEKGCRLSLI